MSDVNVKRHETQIENIRFDDSKSIALKLALIDENSSISSRILKRHALTNDSSTRNIFVNTNRLSFVTIKTSKSSFRKVKVTHNVDSQTLYHEFMILNQARFAIMIFDNESKLFAIKKYKRDSTFHV